MKSAFRVVCSEGAAYLTKDERSELATDAVKRTSKLKPKNAFFIFTDDRGLKVIVRFKKMEVWIMTIQEARASGLPSPSDN